MTQDSFNFDGDGLKTPSHVDPDFLPKIWGRGTHCPVCAQHAKVYSRPLYWPQAYGLIAMHRKIPQGEDIHIKELVVGLKDQSKVRGEFPKLVDWGLIEKAFPFRPDGSSRVGYYHMTKLGVDFVLGLFRAPHRAVTYNKELLGFEGGTISVVEALEDKFDYRELMGN